MQVRVGEGAVREEPTETDRLVLIDGKTVRVPIILPKTALPFTIADVVVRCTDKKCGAVMDSQMFEIAISVIKHEWGLRNAK